MQNFKLKPLAIFALFSSLFISCKKDAMETNVSPEISLDQEMALRANIIGSASFYGLTGTNKLVGYQTSPALQQISSDTITGIQSGEKIMAIDFRPATGQLYGYGSSNRIYIINTKNGVARAVNATPFTPGVNGYLVGFDFNPTVDRIRLVTSSGQNLRLNPETGLVVAIDGDLNPQSPAVSAAAYTNNMAGATTTVLYDIDPKTDMLYMQDPPNNGTLASVGSLGIDVIRRGGGFDIAPDGSAWASLYSGPDTASRLYSINLQTGSALLMGSFTRPIIGLAVPTMPVAYAISDSNNDLLIFDPMNATSVIRKPVTGLQSGETLLGIDFRPVNGQLYALGSTSRLYTLNTSSGLATQVGSGQLSPLLSGSSFGFDFNPTVDRIRIVSNTGQNLRVDPNTGAVSFIDGSLNPGSPNVSGAAYTNNFAGATTTVLYDIDFNTDKLYMQNPPNDGTLIEIGSLGVNAESSNGFDIGGTSNEAYAFLTSVGGGNKLYRINVSNAQAKPVRTFPELVRGFALGLGF